MDLKKLIRTIEDFPDKGILFRDITPILKEPKAFKMSVSKIIDEVSDIDFDLVLGPESRGFIFGVPVSCEMEKGFIPVRKAGKLPYTTVSKTYSLEYGEATIEIHKDAIERGQRVIVVDDLLATGGTTKAITELIEEMGGIVCCIVFLIELENLKGRDVLKGYDVRSILKF